MFKFQLDKSNFLKAIFLYTLLCFLASHNYSIANEVDQYNKIKISLNMYRSDLNKLRKAYGGSYQLPEVDFYLFGMARRDKFIYKNGELINAVTGITIRKWDVEEEIIAPQNYTVALKTKAGNFVFIIENETGLYINENSKASYITKYPVNLPTFAGYKYQSILRVLHQELLINVIDGKPLPNYFVYSKPWYRDSAMMAMVFEKTGNLNLIRDWILGLRVPYDKNNKGVNEADNLGQSLYLISLVSDKSHPLVSVIKKELKQFEKKSWFSKKIWIEGYSDYALHPVYQTKWAKFGLKSLGLNDPYAIPHKEDTYAALFWWEFKSLDAKKQPILREDNYPYLQWAANHYDTKKKGLLSNRDYPLTWEAQASEADYNGMARIAAEHVRLKVSAPHTWHAAEAFLSLIEER